LLANKINLLEVEFEWIGDFVRNGLQDPRATPAKLSEDIPNRLPSGRPLPVFESPQTNSTTTTTTTSLSTGFNSKSRK
jgi:hypothetical protein